MADIPLKFDCVIFDMDGTLTEEHLDFAAIRSEMGVPDCEDILEWRRSLGEDSPVVKNADEVLYRHELTAASQCVAAAGAIESVRAVQEAGLKSALLTRNCRAAMELILQRLALKFDLCYSREDGSIKPKPDSILQACGVLGVSPQRCLCVGDWVYDIQAANAAGCTSVLLVRGRQLDFANIADYCIESMQELTELALAVK